MAVRDIDDKVAQEQARHRALADPSRRELLRVLQSTPEGLDLTEIATLLGVHVNTVRWHLGVLTDAGLVTRETRPATRGRPAHAYRLAERGGEADEQRLLTEILLTALHDASPRAEKQAERAGRARGKTLTLPEPKQPGGKSSSGLDRVLHLLTLLGFQPRRERSRLGPRIAMRPCPFGETLAEHSTIVCAAHLGLVRGALESLKAPLDTIGIEPFASPGTCYIHLRTKKR